MFKNNYNLDKQQQQPFQTVKMYIDKDSLQTRLNGEEGNIYKPEVYEINLCCLMLQVSFFCI